MKLMETPSSRQLLGVSFLEEKPIARRTAEYYYAEFERLWTGSCLNGVAGVSGERLDEELVKYFNDQYFGGYESDRGEKCLAALMHLEPRLGRLGDGKIPLALRAVRGRRLLTPGRSRAAYTLAVWCGLSWPRHGDLRCVGRLHLCEALGTLAADAGLLHPASSRRHLLLEPHVEPG